MQMHIHVHGHTQEQTSNTGTHTCAFMETQIECNKIESETGCKLGLQFAYNSLAPWPAPGYLCSHQTFFKDPSY